MFRPQAVAIERYRYRGTRIPTPWTSADNRITRTSGMNTWRAGCGGSRTSGSEGGPEKPTRRKTGRALRSDPYTYIATGEGWLYLASVLDLGSRRLLGYSMADHMRTELVLDVLAMAVAARRGPSPA